MSNSLAWKAGDSAFQHVQDHRTRQLESTARIVSQAIRGLMSLQGASDVVLAVNHHPAIVELDSLQQRSRVLELAGGTVAARGRQAAADRGDGRAVEILAIEVVGRRNPLELLVRKQL